jgi:O-acetyl-ADP-ribose deacetylase (regulator of RNase III)
VRLVLIDTNADVTRALASAFSPWRDVEIITGDLFEHATNAVVSPANSQGFMDGGIDRAFVDFFGAGLERAVRDVIARRQEGYLPLGASIVLPTGHPRISHVIVVPTMLSPEHVEAQNAYRAMRAVLRVAGQVTPEKGLYCPGLCTGVGGVDPAEAAREMAAAFGDWHAQATGR